MALASFTEMILPRPIIRTATMSMPTCYTLTSLLELGFPTARQTIMVLPLRLRMYGPYFKLSSSSSLSTRIVTLVCLPSLMEDTMDQVS
jgi:hypothetical protein